VERGAGPAQCTTRLLLICGALLGAGCGYVGDPLPPLANVPGRIADLAAVQRGARIIVHFTPPLETTEHVAIKTPLHLDLRIGTAVAPFNADVWAEGARQIAAPAVSKGLAEYEVPVADWTGKQVTLAARAIGANGKSSAWSNFVNLAVLPPPPTPANVTAEPTAAGVKLTWQGGPGDYLIFRRAAEEKNFAQVAKVTQPEWVDSATEAGKSYTYLVQRIVPAGAGIAESDLSDPASITPRDTFPPAAPTGLRVIAAPQSIELTWDRNTEPDLAGYRIYRAFGDGEFTKLADISQLPAYSDRAVEAGKAYRYAVSAVDRAGNESPRSTAVSASL
jgi:fibronectin type 3 domain-containing protein